MQYSDELKDALLRRMLPPNNESITKIAREEGISEQTLRNWRDKARADGIAAPGTSATADKWSTQDKFLIVVETASMSEIELAEYARKKGLYVEQIKAWKDACMNANGGVAQEAARLTKELKAAERTNKQLQKELDRKEKALAESYCNDWQGERWESTSRLFGQSWFIAPQIRLSEEQTKAGGKSYTYYFTVESSLPMVKSGHAVEVAIVFNQPDQTADLSGRTYDETFCKTMRKMWVQFAKTGNPSISAEISPDGKAKVWTPYDLQNKPIMILDEFNIHIENESALKIVDWEKSYFLTNYYLI